MQAAKKVREGSSDELAVIAHYAQAFTNASGTAIALSEGNADEIICRARAGSNAPEVGTALRVQGTFTGLCIQSGMELRCDDAETDSRVDKAAIRALGIRSMLAIPIKEEGRAIGVLAVFAPTARAFTITHLAVLKTMADQVEAYLERKQRPQHQNQAAFSPEPFAAPPVKPVASSAPARPTPPTGLVIKPPTNASAPRQLPVVPEGVPVRARKLAEEILGAARPIPAVPDRTDPAPAPSSKKKDVSSERAQNASKRELWPGFRTLDAAATSGKRPSAKVLIIGAAAVVIVAVAAILLFKLLKPAAAPQAAIAASSSTATAAPPDLVSANVQPPAENTSPAPAATDEEAQPKREQTVVLSARPSRIPRAKDNPAPSSEVPAIALLSGPAAGSLSNLASPVSQTSRARLLTRSELEPITVIKKVLPVYPLVAKQRALSGTVVVQGTVNKNGKISGLQLISGPPVFRDAAFEAVKQWVFKPARLNGQPIEQETKIRLDFGAH
jgi:TonB family protein